MILALVTVALAALACAGPTRDTVECLVQRLARSVPTQNAVEVFTDRTPGVQRLARSVAVESVTPTYHQVYTVRFPILNVQARSTRETSEGSIMEKDEKTVEETEPMKHQGEMTKDHEEHHAAEPVPETASKTMDAMALRENARGKRSYGPPYIYRI